MSTKTGSIFLIPSTLGDTPPEKVLPAYNLQLLQNLNVFIVEEIRSARRFLRKCGYNKDFETTIFHILNEHTPENEIFSFLEQAKSAIDTGLLSEAGCPAVADPGSLVVKLAHEMNIKVIPLSGPSSIIMALMASGFNGQNFTFHGYLPVKSPERIKKIREIEKELIRSGQTHIFIEAPYRNKQMIEAILSSCSGETMLCIASNISLADESVKSATIGQWKKLNHDPGKKPTVFLLSR
jgi:16S rRNA (cytidine1402-2'-O)-methyltransferase